MLLGEFDQVIFVTPMTQYLTRSLYPINVSQFLKTVPKNRITTWSPNSNSLPSGKGFLVFCFFFFSMKQLYGHLSLTLKKSHL